MNQVAEQPPNRRRDERADASTEVLIIPTGEDASDADGSFNLLQGWSHDVAAGGVRFETGTRLPGKPSILLLVKLPKKGCSFCEGRIVGENERDGRWVYRVEFDRVTYESKPHI